MQLAIGAIFEMCDFFSLQINERRFLEFALKCLILGFFLNVRLGSSQWIIIDFQFNFRIGNWHRGCTYSGRGVPEKISAVGFCLGSGLFGSCNSD